MLYANYISITLETNNETNPLCTYLALLFFRGKPQGTGTMVSRDEFMSSWLAATGNNHWPQGYAMEWSTEDAITPKPWKTSDWGLHARPEAHVADRWPSGSWKEMHRLVPHMRSALPHSGLWQSHPYPGCRLGTRSQTPARHPGMRSFSNATLTGARGSLQHGLRFAW